MAPYSDHHGVGAFGESMVVRCLGLVMFVLGFGVMNWAEASLGRQFSVQVTLQEAHQLVTSGPYQHVRHPRYLGVIVFSTGLALVFRSWLSPADAGFAFPWRQRYTLDGQNEGASVWLT